MKEKNFEFGHNPEQQEKVSKIILSFFRHDDKETDKTKSDEKINLTGRGKKHAASLAEDLKNPTLAKAGGSSRIRTQQTAFLKMEGKNVDIENAEEDLSDLISKKGILGMPKVIKDDRLNFFINSKSGTGKKGFDAFKRGKYLRWLIEESDETATKYKDLDENSTYSKSAAGVASIVKDYLNASGRWDQIVKAEKTRKFPKGYASELERFFGSHLGVTESFLAKLIEKTEGIKERDKFIESLDEKGFGFSEGFKVEIINRNDDKKILVEFEKKYKDKDGNDKTFQFKKEIDLEIIDKIIKEGEELEKKAARLADVSNNTIINIEPGK